ncbi:MULTISPECIES: hypothetical protein [unclassified Ensifer]|uniref:hypothetical protein n=1 Tax=unclassified Ensifer TaxID=2633371 RepID=UPI000813A093|nr:MULTISPECIES: hypothetical protein [unclassified Ensifer]OCP04992.1 hypothetical protein BC362_14630 [Ensifer sp. LC14]OCP11849.1 hypothetical protein BC374_16375 [Ensifer sp. LC13]OCP12406.1 hypothetical protein BBX50_16575 [Ensifer sp. LC11]OCP33627.1 hypothetical protein BC364_15270 [Ensifer sp. LC499]
MVRTFFGLDTTGYPCIKMTNDADDPRTTPDSERWKFRYNSKFSIQANFADMELCNVISRPGLNDSAVYNYHPAGSNSGNYQRCEGSGSGLSEWFYRNSAFPTLRYNVPLFDWKTKKGGGSNRYNQQMVAWADSGAYYRGQGGYYAVGNWAQVGWVQGFTGTVSQYGSMAFGALTRLYANDTIDGFNKFLSRDKRLNVWNLPGNSDPIDEAPPLPPNGSRIIQVSPNFVGASKPGYDVRTATVRELAFSNNRLPVKVIKAADIALPAGVSFYETGIALPDMVALDVHFYTGSVIHYPSSPVDLDFGAEYWFDGTKIYFDATQAMRARFYLYLEDNSAPTGGSFMVFRQFIENGVKVTQFLRPGAANPPSWADIIIDSRWPQVQILKEGYFDVAEGNDLMVDIPFDGTGMFPMVKYITTHGGGSYQTLGFTVSGTWNAMYRLPFVKRLKYIYGGNQYHAGESTYCELTANNVRFHTFRGNVGDYYNRGDSPGNWRTSGAYPPIGIRYYIFGIPA